MTLAIDLLKLQFQCRRKLEPKHLDSQTRIFDLEYQHNALFFFPFRNVFRLVHIECGPSKVLI